MFLIGRDAADHRPRHRSAEPGRGVTSRYAKERRGSAGIERLAAADRHAHDGVTRGVEELLPVRAPQRTLAPRVRNLPLLGAEGIAAYVDLVAHRCARLIGHPAAVG